MELSSFQLFWAPSLRPEAGVVLNIAEDHLDWHGGFEAYAAAKARALDGRVAVVGLDDAPATALLPAAGAPVKVGFRLGEPAAGELGVRDGMLVDRAFAERPRAGTGGVDPRRGSGRCARRAGRRRTGARRRRRRPMPSRRHWPASGWAGTAPRPSPSSTG